MIEFYGSPMSSAGRTRWMLEETGAPYAYKRVDPRSGATRSADYLAMYGGGTVPVLRDGDFVLGESMAINFYLAEKYRPELMPSDARERAEVYQWSLWSITNLQPELLAIMFDAMKPPEQRSEARVAAAKKQVDTLLPFLERALTGRDYLVGGRFTVADVNAGSVLNLARVAGLLGAYPHTSAWLARLIARPAFERAAKD